MVQFLKNQMWFGVFIINYDRNIIKSFFSNYEWQYAKKKSKRFQTLAGIWCAKEAVVKAYSDIHTILITDVKLQHQSSGVPFVFSIANEKITSKLKISISISHTKDYATAVAIINVL